MKILKTYPSSGAENPRKRSVPLKITLTPVMHANLVRVAESLGQTPATAASFAVGQFVASQIRVTETTERFTSDLVGQMGGELTSFLKGVPARVSAARKEGKLK